jgi:Protein of unknown function (DUF1553)/Protein of unknown function (DUF1549)
MRKRLVASILLVLASAARAGEPNDQSSLGRSERPVTDEDRSHWAFVKPNRPALPPAVHTDWVRNPIDAFILARLEQSGLSPSPEADRPTLLRRLSFDLTGMPPTPEELDAFLADPSDGAYEKQVERLLASRQYGVRWAQHWLDLARYADTDGFEEDRVRRSAWRYRDWVVWALNHDMPYNTFVRLQIAGDEIQTGDPLAFVATGFNRCYPDSTDEKDLGLRRQNALNDITETTGLAFLGLTIGCARCHDHKFDPIRQVEFYQLQAFFAVAHFEDAHPIAPDAQRRTYEVRVREWKGGIARIQADLIHLEASARKTLAPGLPAGVGAEVVAAYNKPEKDRSLDEVGLIYEALNRDKRLTGEDLKKALGPRGAAAQAELLSRLETVAGTAPLPLPVARGVVDGGRSAPATYLLHRGRYGANDREVSPGFPSVLCAREEGAFPKILPSAQSSGRRRALADWIASPSNPLTARVIVNRLWQHHFGRGIVASPSDFGVMGDPPTDPELLDWLATELVARGWSLKSIHRLIVNSATYRQVSVSLNTAATNVDPENDLLWHQRRRRLDGEAVRDALLSVSGRLNPRLGGPGIFPELPRELANRYDSASHWPVSKNEEDRRRRSLYIFVRRGLRYPFLETFDRPDPSASCSRRTVTTTAPQALSLLNGQLARQAAREIADRVSRESGSDAHPRPQIERAFRLVLGRKPDDDEIKMAVRFLKGNPFEDLCLALININEFLYVF